MPCPSSVTTCVPAPSAMVNIPLNGPVAVGVKMTLALQLAPAAMDPEQLVVSVKLLAGTTEAIFTAAFPVLVKITVCASEDVPTNCPP